VLRRQAEVLLGREGSERPSVARAVCQVSAGLGMGLSQGNLSPGSVAQLGPCTVESPVVSVSPSVMVHTCIPSYLGG
jgi:hypothetical protein